ncbi:MAG: hypothetical protein ACK559_37085, partial [bacterium]
LAGGIVDCGRRLVLGVDADSWPIRLVVDCCRHKTQRIDRVDRPPGGVVHRRGCFRFRIRHRHRPARIVVGGCRHKAFGSDRVDCSASVVIDRRGSEAQRCDRRDDSISIVVIGDRLQPQRINLSSGASC